eukprot:94569_1
MATSNTATSSSLKSILVDLEFLVDSIRNHLNREDAESILLEYAKFLVIKLDLRDYDHKLVSPSAAVDQVWHLHLLYCSRYINFCHKYSNGNQIIDHSPDKDGEQAARLKNTLTEYKKLFGTTPPPPIWDDTYYTSSSTMVPQQSAQPRMTTRPNTNVQAHADKRSKSKIPKCKNGHKMALLSLREFKDMYGKYGAECDFEDCGMPLRQGGYHCDVCEYDICKYCSKYFVYDGEEDYQTRNKENTNNKKRKSTLNRKQLACTKAIRRSAPAGGC